jgi:hypothetical protein
MHTHRFAFFFRNGDMDMRRYSIRSLTVVVLVAGVIAATAGVSAAKTAKVAPGLTTKLSSQSIPLGGTARDTATVTGKAGKGSPTGTVTFSVCGPTSKAVACTSANVSFSVSGGLTGKAHRRSTTSVTIQPSTSGWYCFLDQYSGDTHYKAATDNDTSTECLDVTGGSGKATPTLTTATSPKSIPFGATAQDTATVTGNATFGAPTGTVTFSACGPTSKAMTCTSPNAGSATAQLSPGANNRSTASATLEPGSPGWFCFLDQYNGDSNYAAVTDNDSSTECVDVTNGGGTHTPTLTTATSPKSIPFGSTAQDTATVTGNATFGAPSGSVTFSACGPTTGPTPCTAPNAGSATAGLSPGANNRSTASVTLEPGSPGWYCFLDEYNGDSNYAAVTDNDTATECVDVTNGSGTTTPTLVTAVSPKTIALGSTADDIATVTGKAAFGAPTGSVTFSACGPTSAATPCTSPNVGPVAVELSPGANNRSTAGVSIDPGAPGWYCFLDEYNGDSNYAAVTDNNTATECLDVTGSAAGPNRAATTMTAPRNAAVIRSARRTIPASPSYTATKVVADG